MNGIVTTDKTLTKNPYVLYKHVFYVMLELLKRENINNFFFGSSENNKDLSEFYKFLIRNEHAKKELYDNGFILEKVKKKYTIDRKIKEIYYFKRIT